MRRLTGMMLGGYWRERIAGPLKLDFWIGLPETEWPRVARLYPGKAGKDDLADAFYKQLTTSGTFTRRAFSSPRGLHAIHEMNEPRAWAAGLAGAGRRGHGIGAGEVLSGGGRRDRKPAHAAGAGGPGAAGDLGIRPRPAAADGFHLRRADGPAR